MNTTIENNKFYFVTNYGEKINEKNFNKFFDRPTIRIFTKLTTQNVKLFWYCDFIFFFYNFLLLWCMYGKKNYYFVADFSFEIEFFFVTFFCSQ